MEDDTREAIKNQIKFNEAKAKRAKKEEDEYLRSMKPPEEKKPLMADCDECSHTVPLASLSKRKVVAKEKNKPQDPITGSYSKIYASKNK
jgi:hypothetical protein